MSPFKSGYVGIVGKPNVGKSTLLNRLLGEKIAITSHKPQTTRTRILGILTSKDYQIVFIDTPGIHQPQDQLHHFMMNEINETVKEVDLILFVVEPSMKPSVDDLLCADYLKKTQQPAILVLNKIDRYQTQTEICIEKYNEIAPFKESNCVSALQGTGCDELIATIVKYLPEGPQFYPEDALTDKSERFLISELIREKVYEKLHQEIPYSVAVVTEEVKEKTSKMIYVKAVIYVEKESQKGIIIGNQGQMLKTLGQDARKEIENLLQNKVYLDLWVKVKKNWRKNPTALKSLGLEGE